MNIYLVSRTDSVGEDEYDSFVCYAVAIEDALHMTPTHGARGNYPTWPVDQSKVTATQVGAALYQNSAGVILASFNAG